MSGNYVAWWDPDANIPVGGDHQDYVKNWVTNAIHLCRPATDPNGGCNINIKKDGSGTYVFNYPHHNEPAPIESFTGASLGSVTPVGGGVTYMNRWSPCGKYIIDKGDDNTDTSTHSFIHKVSDTTYIDLGAGVCDADLWTEIPTITVTSPNGGETWTGGASETVTWTSTGGVGNVKIEISTNGGSTWSTLVASTTNDGTEGVVAPDASSNQCLIRVSEVAGSATDTSDDVFTIVDIVAPTVTVTKAVLSGTVDDDKNIPAEVLVNGLTSCPVDSGNKWTTPDITLTGATTNIALTASDSSGNTRQVNVVITK
jgi:hypothetical protein